jgi:hypothetical protein
MHKPSLELLICCASFVGEVLKACVDCLPHTYFCTYLFNQKKQKKRRQARALPAWTLGSLNFFIIIIIIVIIY